MEIEERKCLSRAESTAINATECVIMKNFHWICQVVGHVSGKE